MTGHEKTLGRAIKGREEADKASRKRKEAPGEHTEESRKRGKGTELSDESQDVEFAPDMPLDTPAYFPPDWWHRVGEEYMRYLLEAFREGARPGVAKAEEVAMELYGKRGAVCIRDSAEGYAMTMTWRGGNATFCTSEAPPTAAKTLTDTLEAWIKCVGQPADEYPVFVEDESWLWTYSPPYVDDAVQPADLYPDGCRISRCLNPAASSAEVRSLRVKLAGQSIVFRRGNDSAHFKLYVACGREEFYVRDVANDWKGIQNVFDTLCKSFGSEEGIYAFVGTLQVASPRHVSHFALCKSGGLDQPFAL